MLEGTSYTECRVEVTPQLDRKWVMGRQKADGVAVEGFVKEHQGMDHLRPLEQGKW